MAQKVQGGLTKGTDEETEPWPDCILNCSADFTWGGEGSSGWWVALEKGRKIPGGLSGVPLRCPSSWGEGGEARAAGGARELRLRTTLRLPAGGFNSHQGKNKLREEQGMVCSNHRSF